MKEIRDIGYFLLKPLELSKVPADTGYMVPADTGYMILVGGGRNGCLSSKHSCYPNYSAARN